MVMAATIGNQPEIPERRLYRHISERPLNGRQIHYRLFLK
jgi:hypothetical protein